MSLPPSGGPDDEAFAAELAFGLLEADDARIAEDRERNERDFGEAVERWRAHLALLLEAETGIEEAPDQAVWQAIAAATGDPARGADLDGVLAYRRSLGRWRALSAGLGAIAAALLALLVARSQPVRPAPKTGPQLVALLGVGEAPLLGAATYDADTHRLTVRLRHLQLADRVPELWLIGEDGQPRSLGVVGTPAVWSRVAPPADLDRMANGATLAISLEPVGGSPFGKPTGPVVLSGKLS